MSIPQIHHLPEPPTIEGVPPECQRIMVVVVPNHDCDGYGEGYHRVFMRKDDVAAAMRESYWHQDDKVTPDMLIRRAIGDEVLTMISDATECDLITEGEFFGKHWDRMSPWERDYWFHTGYYSWFKCI